MASSRFVNTNFWHDTYIIELDPIEKLLFLYLLTNSRTTIAGVYEISFRQMAFDTGIDKDMCEKIVKRFQDDGKLIHERGWIILRNFLKHQRMNKSMVAGAQKVVADAPDFIRDKIQSDDFLGIMDTVSPQSGADSPDSPSNIIKLNIIKSNLIKSNKTNAVRPPGDLSDKEIGRLYYQVIEVYKLPIRNHRNVQGAITKMLKEGEDEANLKYLQFLISQYRDLMFDKKPELSEALDIYNKRNQILNGVRRQTIKPSGRGFRV